MLTKTFYRYMDLLGRFEKCKIMLQSTILVVHFVFDKLNEISLLSDFVKES